ncbi:MAG: toll/interleukin-1 receptor domain-containing protein [Hyphomonadaceae bacterium]|nr:toll/interleukin-1 receptor domain-containing protein [Hyphomonadaceae bacterium]
MAQRQAIFIGYRREDTADVAGRIYDALARRFGRARIFKDVDNLKPGADFGAYIRGVLPQCRVFLALIGPHWLDARDDQGRRRLDDPHDWVRVEIETALATPGLTVVPVIVNGARMPRAEEVPPSMQGLLRLHAATVRRDPDFHDDVRRMGEAIKDSVRSGALDLTALGAGVTKADKSAARGRGPGAALIVTMLLVAAAAAYQFAPPALWQAMAGIVRPPPADPAARLVGAWRWSDGVCGQGPVVTREGDLLAFAVEGAPTYRHVVEAVEGGTVRTLVVEPEADRGDAYAWTPDGDTLTMVTGDRTETWTRCK